MDKQGKVIYGFAGCGKSTLAKKYCDKNIFIDLESSDYKYILTDKQKLESVEERKGTKRKVNPDFPQNYFNAILDARKKYEYVFVALCGIIECSKNGVDYWMLFPDYDCKDEYIERYKERGNGKGFVRKFEENFDNYVKMCYENKRPLCSRKIVLHKGEFLEDVLKREKII